MPKTFELKFTKIADNLYSGSLSVEGQQMTFGVPKTKEEIYQFLFGGGMVTVPDPEEKSVEARKPVQPAPTPTPEPMAREGWRFVSSD